MLAGLARLAETVAEVPALLVMTSRVEGEPLDHLWRGAMHGAPLTTMDLGPLRESEAWALAGQSADTASDFARRCVLRAEGNPLFLEQLLRLPESPMEAVPDSVQVIVWARLDTLPPEQRLAVQAASVMGQHVSLEALRHLLGDPAYDPEVLVRHGLFRTEGGLCHFTHALVLEAIYASLLKSERQPYHMKAAAWFADKDAVLHAEQLERAGAPEAAWACGEAARQLAGDYRFARAADMAARGADLAGSPEERFDMTQLRGVLLREAGETHSAIEVQRAALDEAPDDARRVRALIELAAGLQVVDAHEEALDVLAQAEPLLDAGGDPALRSRLYYLRGNLLFPLGRLGECLEAHRKALEEARAIGSREDEAHAMSGLGDAEYLRGALDSAYEHLDGCVRLCREANLRRFEVGNLAMRGIVRFYRMDLAGALEDAREAATLGARLGDARGEALARSLRAQVLIYQGDWDEALLHSQACMALARSVGSLRFETDALLLSALAQGGKGDHEAAAALAWEALAQSRAAGMHYTGPWVLAVVARFSSKPQARQAAQKEAERLLGEGGPFHNHLHYPEQALEGALEAERWDEVERYAGMLEDYTREHPLAWSRFIIARGRALAALGRRREKRKSKSQAKDPQGEAAGRKALGALLEQAHLAGMHPAAEALAAALGDRPAEG